AEDRDDAQAQAEGALASGAARERFQRMVTALGGPWDFLDRFEHYVEAAPIMVSVPATKAGYLAAVDAREVGLAVVGLGGGRRRGDEAIDGRVGFSDILPVGAAVNADRPLAVVHAADDASAREAAARYAAACTITSSAPDPRPVIAERLGANR
ncbi:MAG: thymidine phosphorylase, partial [Pseudomonadota bacterium]